MVAVTPACVGISGIRNGPVRDRMRSANRITSITDTGSSRTVEVERLPDVHDRERPYGFGIGGKTGIAYGGSEPVPRGGYAQDLSAFVVRTIGDRWSLSPQAGFFMNLHGSQMQGRAQVALGIPLDLDVGLRVADRMTIHASGGRTVWGAISNANAKSSATFWRGKLGTQLVVRNGGYDRFELTLGLDAFVTSGAGGSLDYSAYGGLVQLDVTGTGSGY